MNPIRIVSFITLTSALLLAFAGTAEAKPNIKTKTAQTIVATWNCQDRMGWQRTAARSPWKPHSGAYRAAELQRWQERWRACTYAIKVRTIPATNDWMTAVGLVQRIYPGTAGWLTYISNREGGHGRFVMNHQGSGAGGWMQFMSSTYYAYSAAAFADARARGYIIDGNWNVWYSPLGQAITAGYMRYTGRDGCHWCL